MITGLIKRMFHERPLQPKYSKTWDAAMVIGYRNSLGENHQMSIQGLTLKTVMLTQPSRWSVDLANLNQNYQLFSPKGVTFPPTKLTNQSIKSEQCSVRSLLSDIPTEPMTITTLRAYEDKIKERRCDYDTVVAATERGGLNLKPPKFEHIFVTIITSPPPPPPPPLFLLCRYF